MDPDFTGLHVVALASGSLSEVHADVGGYQVIHLVALFIKKREEKNAKNINSNFVKKKQKENSKQPTSDVSQRNLLPFTKLPTVM